MWYHSTLGLRVMKKKKDCFWQEVPGPLQVTLTPQSQARTPYPSPRVGDGCQVWCATLGRSQDVCKGSQLPVEGERCVVSS